LASRWRSCARSPRTWEWTRKIWRACCKASAMPRRKVVARPVHRSKGSTGLQPGLSGMSMPLW
jgi:hypothetical protein